MQFLPLTCYLLWALAVSMIKCVYNTLVTSGYQRYTSEDFLAESLSMVYYLRTMRNVLNSDYGYLKVLSCVYNYIR